MFSFCFLVHFDMIFFIHRVLSVSLLHASTPTTTSRSASRDTVARAAPANTTLTLTQPDSAQRTHEAVCHCGPFGWLPASHRALRMHSLKYLITQTDVRMCLITVNWWKSAIVVQRLYDACRYSYSEFFLSLIVLWNLNERNASH